LTEPPDRFCMKCGAELVVQYQFGQDRPTCPSCGWIFFADPKVAAAVIVEREGQVLLTRRVNQPFQGLWTLPAGFVNANEDPARAAERECLEETGLLVQVTALVDVIAGREHSRGADMVVLYRANITGGQLQPGDDADMAGFFAYDQLPPLAFLATRKALGLL
jgi:ADP-ribose pyrophosphatase YjhB (NUDIX family)